MGYLLAWQRLCTTLAASGASGNKALKLSDSVRNGITKLHQNGHHWLDPKRFKIGEEYLNGRLGILIQFEAMAHWNLDAADSRAIWGDMHADCDSRSAEPNTDFSALVEDFYSPVKLESCRKWCECFVFVRDIGLVQYVKQFSGTTFVRTKLDEEVRRISSGRFYSFADGFVVGLYPPRGRELKRTILCTAIEPNQFPRRMVERRSQVMDSIAGDEGQTRREWLAEAGVEGYISGLRIGVWDDRLWMGFAKSGNGVLKVGNELIGPLNL
jgi:hypothetical protein